MSGVSAAIVCTAHLRSYWPSLSKPCWMLNVMTLKVPPDAAFETLEGPVPGADELPEPHAMTRPSSPSNAALRTERIGPTDARGVPPGVTSSRVGRATTLQ